MYLREYFESLLPKQSANISEREKTHLDLKLISKPEMAKEDRKNPAKTIPGFANPDGGLIDSLMQKGANDESQ